MTTPNPLNVSERILTYPWSITTPPLRKSFSHNGDRIDLVHPNPTTWIIRCQHHAQRFSTTVDTVDDAHITYIDTVEYLASVGVRFDTTDVKNTPTTTTIPQHPRQILDNAGHTTQDHSPRWWAALTAYNPDPHVSYKAMNRYDGHHPSLADWCQNRFVTPLARCLPGIDEISRRRVGGTLPNAMYTDIHNVVVGKLSDGAFARTLAHDLTGIETRDAPDGGVYVWIMP